MKRFSGWVLAVMLVVPATGITGGFEFDINANNTIIEGRIGFFREWLQNTVISGGGSVIYNKDDFTLYGVDMTYGTSWLPNLRLDVGLKGVAGTVENFPEDAEVGAAAFLIGGTYDILADRMMFPFDLTLSAKLCVAPKPMNFRDNDEYVEFNGFIGIPIFPGKSGMILGGVRYIRMGFDDVANLSSLDDTAAYIGLKFRFMGL